MNVFNLGVLADPEAIRESVRDDGSGVTFKYGKRSTYLRLPVLIVCQEDPCGWSRKAASALEFTAALEGHRSSHGDRWRLHFVPQSPDSLAELVDNGRGCCGRS